MQDAKDLVKLLKGMLCHVNLIPINKIENGKYTKSTNENILKFRDYLNKKGIVATVRRELGSDIDAACGQLRKKRWKDASLRKTDIGKAREMNQDFYYVSQVNENMALCILADGMGGYKGGEIASSLATNSSKEYIEENFDKIEHSDEEIMNLIKSAMDYANIAVYKKQKQMKN